MQKGGPRHNSDIAKSPASSVTVGTSSVTVAAANGARVELTICNDHASNVVYLSLGSAAAQANKGIRLSGAGGSYTSRAYTGAVTAISTGASTPVLVTET